MTDQTQPKSPAIDGDNDTVAIPRPANEFEDTPGDDDDIEDDGADDEEDLDEGD